MNPEDFNWTPEPVIGSALLIAGGETDSFTNKIDPYIYYEVGKHKISGMVAILPTKRNFRNEFAGDIMKKTGQAN